MKKYLNKLWGIIIIVVTMIIPFSYFQERHSESRIVRDK